MTLREYIAALGLYDAARDLRPFVQDPTTTTDVYFVKASDARTYLYDLYSFWSAQSNGHADYFLPFRAQAMLDIASFDYSSSAGDLNAATSKMVVDLQTVGPTTSDNIRGYWILGNEFSNAPNGAEPDLSAYAAFEPLFYFVEHGVPDGPVTMPGHQTWQEALDDIGERYYHQTLLPGAGNPLRITRNWPPDVDATDYFGDDVYSNHKVAIEAYATARLAQNATRSGANYGRFVQLATGDLNWILGLHRGALSRHVKSANGIADTDLEFSPASFVSGVGRRTGIQVVYAIHSPDWTQPTVLSGLGGQLHIGTPPGPDWPVAPFEFSRGQYPTSETFIKTDGNVLMAVETLGRVLHPRGIIEAENYSSAFKASGGIPMTATNNEWNPGGTDRPNGGLSVMGLVNGDWLQWSVFPPEPALGGSLSDVYQYTLMLRAANPSSSTSANVQVTVSSPGLPSWTGSVSILPTGDDQEYMIATTPAASPISMKSGVLWSIKLDFQGGPCSVDDLVLVSGGVMQ